MVQVSHTMGLCGCNGFVLGIGELCSKHILLCYAGIASETFLLYPWLWSTTWHSRTPCHLSSWGHSGYNLDHGSSAIC